MSQLKSGEYSLSSLTLIYSPSSTSSTHTVVVTYSNEKFSFKWKLPSCFFLPPKKAGQQREDGCKIDHSHLNKTLSFELDATVRMYVLDLIWQMAPWLCSIQKSESLRTYLFVLGGLVGGNVLVLTTYILLIVSASALRSSLFALCRQRLIKHACSDRRLLFWPDLILLVDSSYVREIEGRVILVNLSTSLKGSLLPLSLTFTTSQRSRLS